MKGIAYDAEALDELDHALAVSRNPNGFRQLVEGKLADIAGGVVVHPVYPGTLCRYCLLGGSLPYSLVYIDAPTEIQVVALAHHKRRPGYWKRRLRPS